MTRLKIKIHKAVSPFLYVIRNHGDWTERHRGLKRSKWNSDNKKPRWVVSVCFTLTLPSSWSNSLMGGGGGCGNEAWTWTFDAFIFLHVERCQMRSTEPKVAPCPPTLTKPHDQSGSSKKVSPYEVWIRSFSPLCTWQCQKTTSGWIPWSSRCVDLIEWTNFIRRVLTHDICKRLRPSSWWCIVWKTCETSIWAITISNNKASKVGAPTATGLNKEILTTQYTNMFN